MWRGRRTGRVLLRRAAAWPKAVTVDPFIASKKNKKKKTTGETTANPVRPENHERRRDERRDERRVTVRRDAVEEKLGNRRGVSTRSRNTRNRKTLGNRPRTTTIRYTHDVANDVGESVSNATVHVSRWSRRIKRRGGGVYRGSGSRE